MKKFDVTAEGASLSCDNVRLGGEDIKLITARDFIDEIARSLDPLAFKNRDRRDMSRRKVAVYRRIRLAYEEYRRRESCYDYNNPGIQEADIPW